MHCCPATQSAESNGGVYAVRPLQGRMRMEKGTGGRLQRSDWESACPSVAVVVVVVVLSVVFSDLRRQQLNYEGVRTQRNGSLRSEQWLSIMAKQRKKRMTTTHPAKCKVKTRAAESDSTDLNGSPLQQNKNTNNQCNNPDLSFFFPKGNQDMAMILGI
ncbi:hypothetical protein SODALDRAFT_379489 [Sodiomyces alkalinus F11]|uniref:Uncharacterized protein n=1 Tax=Sodiomyces alkalinus (strain CBS 110278 / VKM F-3762 / F11) TaxID=1314773 RepID=A0A3N2PUX4_SODAK|nr:hypothetical protein SODALDRAFT_379489 [Sodiomyces alkalinus F11]ROT38303.1 hypothetical protein SODALDRAFT_379489 [Sodiomyces alkalinus F11]